MTNSEKSNGKEHALYVGGYRDNSLGASSWVTYKIMICGTSHRPQHDVGICVGPCVKIYNLTQADGAVANHGFGVAGLGSEIE